MLKLKNISSHIRTIHNESDYYVTIKIMLERIDLCEGVCYWNAYGKENSFVQIGLSNPTGAIYKIVSFFNSINYYTALNPFIIDFSIPQKIGLPLFETYIEKYQDEYYHLPDEHINFQIYATQKNISIAFSSNKVILHVINDSIVFGFDQDKNLCYINLQNMTLNEEGFLKNI